MIALFYLTRSQLSVDPVQPAQLARRVPSEVSDPMVTIDTSKMTLALEEGSKKSTSASKGFHHDRVGDTILDHQVRQRIADRIMWS